MAKLTTLDRLDVGRFQRLARALSRKGDVEVSLVGNACMTDGKRIYLPANSDELKDTDKQILHGMLDHEVSHVWEEQEVVLKRERGIACKSPLEIIRDAKNNAERMMFNVYEDIRIERTASDRYQGVGENLRALGQHSVTLFQKDMAAGKTHDVWQALGSGVIMQAHGLPVDWLAEELQPILEILHQEVLDSRVAATPEETHELALRTLSKIKELMEEARREEERRKAEEEAAGGGAGEGSTTVVMVGPPGSEGGGGASVELPVGTEAPGKPEGAEEGPGKGVGGPGPAPTDGGPAASPESSAAKEADKEPPRTARKALPPGTKVVFAKMEKKEFEAVKKALDEAGSKDAEVDDLLKRAKGAVETASKEDVKSHGRWVVDPAAVKEDRLIKPKGDLEDYNRSRSAVAGQIATLRTKLSTVLRVRGQARLAGDQETGVLDTSSLYSLRLGNKRVFAQKTKQETLDVSISLLIDMSGSMYAGTAPGSKSYCAKLMAIALAETFSSLNIPFEAIGFTNTYKRGRGTDSGYTRYLPFDFHLFKGFDESFRSVRARFAGITGLEENVDGDALLFVARRLAVRKEERKLLFVLSDGLPSGGCHSSSSNIEHLHHCIQQIGKSGIEVYGIGACSDSVREFYTKKNHAAGHIVVNDIGTLAVEVFKLVKDRLLCNERRSA